MGTMRLSIRNQIEGTVASIDRGEVMGTVRLSTAGPDVIAAITLDAIDELKLAEGQPAVALIKSTEVAVAIGPIGSVSIRNRFEGTIMAVDHGVVMTTVKVAIAGGAALTAVITKDGSEDLSLSAGDEVTALVKSTEISIAIP
jgi:molybdate transport system regulatory protein